MKKIILIVLLLVILALGIVGGLSMFGLGPFPNLMATLFKPSENKLVAAPPAEAMERTFDLGTFIIPLISAHAIGRQVGMDLVIVVDANAAPRVSGELPRLQNALLVDLYDFVPQHSDTHSAANKEAIHLRLVKVAARLFGESAIHDVVIKSIYDR